MVCGYFILPEPASYVFFYAIFNLRNLFYLIRVGQRVSLDETPKIKCHKKLQIIEENHRNQVIPVIFGGDYWTRTSGLMRVKIR